jgi:hypothetical protein
MPPPCGSLTAGGFGILQTETNSTHAGMKACAVFPAYDAYVAFPVGGFRFGLRELVLDTVQLAYKFCKIKLKY